MALGDLVVLLSGGTPSKSRVDYWNGSVPWASAKDMKRLRLYDTQDRVTREAIENGTRVVPAKSVLILVRGMTLLNDVPVCIVQRPMAFNQDVKALRPKPAIDEEFLPYLILGSKPRLLGLVDLASHGTGRINTQELNALQVRVPPLPEQRTIANILGTLDDKIELNRRMNQTLEEMARAIFKDWFMDFGPTRAKMEGRDPYLPTEVWDLFPDSLEDSELGEIPAGWEVKSIEDIAERVAMGPFGSSIKVSTFVDSGVPIISGQHLKETLLEDGDYRFITEDHAERLAKANVKRGDIIFTHAGSIGQVAYIPRTSQYKRYVISQRQFYLRCDTSKVSPLFVLHFFKTHQGQHQLLANTSSTGVPSISRPVTYLRSIPLCVPSRALWSAFHDIAGSLHAAIGHNTDESRTLFAQRDVLLPKLVSGALRLPSNETDLIE